MKLALLHLRTLMHKCFPEDLRIGTVKLKQDKETSEEDKQKRVNVERAYRPPGVATSK